MEIPLPSEQYITIIDNRGRERIQSVEYIVHDIAQEKIYVTFEGLAYTRDSLTLKGQIYMLSVLERLPEILQEPDIVIWDPVDDPDETLIYYKYLFVSDLFENKLVATIVKIRNGIKFFYNLFLQESGKVKGCTVVPSSEIRIWYLAPRVRRIQFGL